MLLLYAFSQQNKTNAAYYFDFLHKYLFPNTMGLCMQTLQESI